MFSLWELNSDKIADSSHCNSVQEKRSGHYDLEAMKKSLINQFEDEGGGGVGIPSVTFGSKEIKTKVEIKLPITNFDAAVGKTAALPAPSHYPAEASGAHISCYRSVDLPGSISKLNSFFSQMGPFEVFAYGPTLKFKLSWSGAPLARPPRRPTSLPLRAPLTSQNVASTNDVRSPAEEANGNNENRKKQRIFYQFIYNNNTRQQTEAREDLYCPWCSIDCRRLYSLLKHLKLCHRRFIFTYAVSTCIFMSTWSSVAL